jgi:hypothetical protein
MWRVRGPSTSPSSPLPPILVPSALDEISTALDYSAVPSVLLPEQRRLLASSSAPSSAGDVYGRGPGSLLFSHSKRLVIAAALATVLFAAISVEFLCYYRGFCFAEEATGNGDGTGGARRVYSSAQAQAVVPVALLLSLLVAPLSLGAAHVQVMAVALLAFAVNATACGLLVLTGIATLSFLADMDETAAATWASLPLSVRAVSYGGDVSLLASEMSGDAAAVGTVALAGAAVTGLAALFLFPLANTQLFAFLAGKGAGTGSRAARWTALCCAVTPLSYVHDGAYGQGDTTKAVGRMVSACADRTCPVFAARVRLACASVQGRGASLAASAATGGGGAVDTYVRGPWRACTSLFSMTTTEARAALAARGGGGVGAGAAATIAGRPGVGGGGGGGGGGTGVGAA